ncbi:MAG: von Willebrand factor type A domain protein [Deltaproteobacteria bacterium ADurb.Bin058]|nr:MAG: von Willebrand factor type A domain protein [Deltaproteobacteria bacterium ADurb.Bin058]
MRYKNQTVTDRGTINWGLQRPLWVSSKAKQNVVLVRDASGSMYGAKADDASAASADLISELAKPCNKDAFSVALVDFAEETVSSNLEKATALNGKVVPFTVGTLGSCTNITAGLDAALTILQLAPTEEGVVSLRPVVIAFTDGQHNVGPQPQAVATRIKALADLVTVAFGEDADEVLMKSLATSPQHFYRCQSGIELRAFLAAVGATITGTLAAGANATDQLARIRG